MCGGGARLRLQPHKPHLAAAGSLSCCAWVCRWEGNQIETETQQQAAAWQGPWGRAGQRAGVRGQRRGAELLPLTLSEAGAPVLPWAGDPHPLWADTSRTSSPSVLGGE